MLDIIKGIVVVCLLIQITGIYDFRKLFGSSEPTTTSVTGSTPFGPTTFGPTTFGTAPFGSALGPTTGSTAVPTTFGTAPFGSTSGSATPEPAVTQVLNTGNVKFIELKKTVTELNGDSILNFAELKVYDNNENLLLPARFESAVHNPAEGWGNNEYPAINCVDGDDNNFCSSSWALETSMLFTLKEPSFVKRITILNRLDNSYNKRIKGVKVNLFDRNMGLINTCTLLNNNRSQECKW